MAQGQNEQKLIIEKTKRELERKSQDRIKVHNPLFESFTTVWDGYKHTVSGKEDKVFPRYIAEKFLREIVVHRINLLNSKLVENENNKRIRAGMKEMTKYEERLMFDKRTDNEDLWKNFISDSYKGLVEEYGVEVGQKVSEKEDRRPMIERMLGDIEKTQQFIDETPIKKESFEDKKEEVVKGATA